MSTTLSPKQSSGRPRRERNQARRGGLPVERATVKFCWLRALPGPILGQLWPAERIVAGMRTSTWLRGELVRNAQRISLHGRWVRFDEELAEQRIRADLTRFYHASRAISLEIGCSPRSPAKHSLSGCDSLTSAVISALYDATVPSQFADARADSVHTDTSSSTSAQAPAPLRAHHAPPLTQLVLKRVSLCHSETCKLAMVVEASAAFLTHLSVAQARLPADGARMLTVQLARCSHLSRLELSECGFQLGLAGARRLAAVIRGSRLAHLGLARMGLGPDGAEAVAAALGGELRELDLRGNAIEDQGAAAVAKWVGGGKSTGLTRLDLSGNRIGEGVGEEVAGLLGALGRHGALAQLELSANRLVGRGDAGLAQLRGCSGLTELGVGGVSMVREQEGASVGGFAGLCAALPELGALTSLDVSHHGVGAVGAGLLGARLGAMLGLVRLEMSWNALGEAGAAALGAGLGQCPGLQLLGLRGNCIEESGEGGLARSVGQLTRLTQLDLSENRIGAGGAGRIAAAVGRGGSIRTLDLSDNELGDEGAAQLARWLGKCGSLQTLRLGTEHPDLGQAGLGEGLGCLGAALKGCTALTELDLSCNPAGAAAGRLAGGIGQCKALVKVDLLGCSLGDGGAGRLARGLGLCGALREVHLCCNNISCAGAARLAAGLGRCEGLTYLRITDNEIADRGAAALAEGLCNVALETLDLSDNKVGDAGAASLARLLRGCASLATLNLFANEVGDDGAIALAEAAAAAPGLRTLRLARNNLGPRGMQHVHRVLANAAAYDEVLGQW